MHKVNLKISQETPNTMQLRRGKSWWRLEARPELDSYDRELGEYTRYYAWIRHHSPRYPTSTWDSHPWQGIYPTEWQCLTSETGILIYQIMRGE